MISRQSMRTTLIAGLFLGSLVAIAGLARAQGGGASEAPPGAFKVDPVHSSVVFKIKHLGTANFYGRFNEASGTFDLGGGAINVQINMNSVNSGNEKRDQHLKGPDFFSVKEFPQAAFKSTSVKSAGTGLYEVSGDMTLHGVTRPVTAKVEFTGTGKGMRGGTVAGIEARLTIKRSDFGMNYRPDVLGDEVEIIAALEGGQ